MAELGPEFKSSSLMLLKVWSVDQQQQQLGAGWKCGISGPTPDLQNQRGHSPGRLGHAFSFLKHSLRIARFSMVPFSLEENLMV